MCASANRPLPSFFLCACHGQQCITFEAIAAVLAPAIAQHFPDPAVRVIAEPGRYYVAPAFTLATAITSRRAVYPAVAAAGVAADDAAVPGRAAAGVGVIEESGA